MLSLSCKTSIKAVVYLGSKFESAEKSSIKDVAEFINENEHTVGKILQALAKQGIINSTKGPHGGFYLTDKQVNQRVINIVEVIDGEDVFKKCGLGLRKCSESRPCPFHDNYKPIRDAFETLCNEKKITDLYENINNNLTFLTG